MKGRKIYKLVLCFIFALSMIFALAACMNEEEKEEKAHHIVTFINDDVVVGTQDVIDGQKIAEPTPPAKKGYVFCGWYVGNEKWSFIGYTVTEDIELTAAWVLCTDHSYVEDPRVCDICDEDRPPFKVMFYTSGGSPKPEQQNVLWGDMVIEPQAPKKVGYVFDGWYDGDKFWNFSSDVVTTVVELIACWTKCTAHTDENVDYTCDDCGVVNPVEGFVINYPWDSQTLIFQFTENDNNREFSSGCHRYLAGDDSTYTKAIDTSIDQRNARAKIATKIDVTYLYWENTSAYGFGKCIDQIEQLVKSKTVKNAPDVYVNFMYDMVGCAVKGYFANLKGTSRGTGELAGLNYFEFNDADYDESVDNRGYMNDWMNSLAFSQHKMYILGSDYFTDIIRAEFIIPVGIGLLEKYGENITGDRNKDGAFTIDDFYEQVYAGEWTYDLLMEYADAVKMDDGDNTTDSWLGDKQVGFAISSSNIATSGLLYSSSVRMIERKWDIYARDWSYYYPDDNEELGSFSNAVQKLLAAPGVVYVNSQNSGKYDISTWGGSGSGNHIKAIRTRFSTGNVLFGDIMMVGALEYEEYQSMRGGSSFGVVVVPLYHADAGFKKDAPYLTQIHNMARPGAIAKNTTKFVECTAYLNYQSAHSTDILNEYYNYELMYNIAGAAQGTVKMLQYVRANIRDSFDKSIEDVTNVFYGEEANEAKILSIITRSSWQVDDIRGDYKLALTTKRGYLNGLTIWFESAAD